MTPSQLAEIIAVIGVITSIGTAYMGYKKGLKQDGNAEGSLRSDVGYIKAGVDDLKAEQKNLTSKHYDLSDRVARAEESVKSAHHRIDGIENRLEELK